jgi:hypothetical protein
MTPLRIYSDPSFRNMTLRRSPLVYPYWGDDVRYTVAHKQSFLAHQYDTTYYEFTDNPDTCDVYFWPFNYWATKSKGQLALFDRALQNAREHKKKLLIDAFGDTMEVLPYDDVIVLRFAQYRRHLKANDIIIPAYVEDLLETQYDGKLSVRKKGEKPTVGFAGWGRLPFWKHIRSYLKEVPVYLWSLLSPKDAVFRKGVFLRTEALSLLKKSPRINTTFLIRRSYSGNVRTAEKNPDVLRTEFVRNIVDTDFTLCQKGDGNQSTRFYETLSLGRIPLLIDTECVFPLEHGLAYEEFCGRINYTDLPRAADILADFYARLSPKDFTDMQKKARAAYEKVLRIDSFTPFLMDEIRSRL